MRRLRTPLFGLFFLLVSLYSIGESLTRPVGHDRVSVQSEPIGATVIVDGRIEGTTPLLLYLSTNAAHSIRLEHAGYLACETVVEPVLRWGVFTRLLFGHPAAGAVETAVDVATGHTRKLSPSTVHIYMQRCGEIQAELMSQVVSEMLWPVQ